MDIKHVDGSHLTHERTAVKAKGWCFTVNNYSASDVKVLDGLVDAEQLVYLCYGLEEAPSTGTKHVQGYLYASSRVYFTAVKRMLPVGTHIECAKGSPMQNRVYCSKGRVAGGVFKEYGVCPRHERGKRNDLQLVRDAVGADLDLGDVMMMCDNVQQMKCAEILMKYHTVPYRGPRSVFVRWYWGATGTGKTTSAYEYGVQRYSGDVWQSSCDLKWFDGYSGQRCVLFDDLRADHLTFSFLLRLLDVYPLRVPIKGGFVQWRPKCILITCPQKPEDFCAHYYNECHDQLLRRVTEVIECKPRVMEVVDLTEEEGPGRV